MVVKWHRGPGFSSLVTDTFVLNWKTFYFPPSRNGLPLYETTPCNKFQISGDSHNVFISLILDYAVGKEIKIIIFNDCNVISVVIMSII